MKTAYKKKSKNLGDTNKGIQPQPKPEEVIPSLDVEEKETDGVRLLEDGGYRKSEDDGYRLLEKK